VEVIHQDKGDKTIRNNLLVAGLDEIA
jgi:hypothetical protein